MFSFVLNPGRLRGRWKKTLNAPFFKSKPWCRSVESYLPGWGMDSTPVVLAAIRLQTYISNHLCRSKMCVMLGFSVKVSGVVVQISTRCWKTFHLSRWKGDRSVLVWHDGIEKPAYNLIIFPANNMAIEIWPYQTCIELNGCFFSVLSESLSIWRQ